MHLDKNEREIHAGDFILVTPDNKTRAVIGRVASLVDHADAGTVEWPSAEEEPNKRPCLQCGQMSGHHAAQVRTFSCSSAEVVLRSNGAEPWDEDDDFENSDRGGGHDDGPEDGDDDEPESPATDETLAQDAPGAESPADAAPAPADGVGVVAPVPSSLAPAIVEGMAQPVTVFPVDEPSTSAAVTDKKGLASDANPVEP